MPIYRHLALTLGAVALVAAAPLFVVLDAQEVTALSVTAAEGGSPATKAALTVSTILAGASGAQWLKSPEAWPLTIGGFGQRVADRVGFYSVQTLSAHVVESMLDYRPDAVVCPRRDLINCSVVSTLTAFNRVGERRANWPMLTGIAMGTAASLLWRPEGRDYGETWYFVGSRMSITVGGYVAQRFVVDWWAQRKR